MDFNPNLDDDETIVPNKPVEPTEMPTVYEPTSIVIESNRQNKELISNFTKAIQKGLDFVHNHSDREVAEAILSQFPDTSLNDLEEAIKRYRENDTWPKTTTFTKESFDHLQDIMIDYGALDKKVPYSKLIYNEK